MSTQAAQAKNNHKTAKRVSIIAAIAAAAVALMIAIPSVGGAAAKWTEKADPDTSDLSTTSTTLSTEDVGEVVTDKSVSTDTDGDGNFDVQLSALSSALASSEKSGDPLDIVMVLDVSGSMSQSYASSGYVSVYDLDTTQTYYIYSSGGYYNGVYYRVGYYPVRYSSTYGGWYYYMSGFNYNWGPFVPKTSSSDTDSSHFQFYDYQTSSSTKTKLKALQESADSFIESINKVNANLPDDKKHRISLVVFAGDEKDSPYAIGDLTDTDGNTYPYTYNSVYTGQTTIDVNYTQIVSDFTTDADALKTQVDNTTAAGMTRTDNAMDLASALLDTSNNGTTFTNGHTDGRQGVVVLFSDGEPTKTDDYNEVVAGKAMEKATSLKNAGTLIYTIGATAYADPNDTTNDFNKFLNGMSSNYPEATATYSEGSSSTSENDDTGSITLGTRVSEDKDYYFKATNPQELQIAFEEIFKDITTPANYPTETSSDPATSGYITFSDTLGDYMEVKGITSITFNGVEYPVTDNGDGTYTCDQAVTPSLSSSGNLSSIKITVTTSSATATGDTVTVEVPAALMPLDVYNVATEDGTTTLTKESAQPIKVNYTVGLKSTVKSNIDENDFSDISTDYRAANTDASGNLSFYTNSYTAGADNGLTTATFSPASTNGYYVFTSDTPLYTSDDGTDTAVTSIPDTPTESVYYKDPYWTTDADGTVTEHTYRELTADEMIAMGSSAFFVQDGQVYVYSGTTHPSVETSTAKNPNTTETANNVRSTSFTSQGLVSDALGNNGKLSVPMPGSLSIHKTIDVPSGYADQSNTDFTFNIYVADASGSYNCTVTDATGQTVSGAQTTITFDSSGNATCTLKGGQTITIDGLQSGSSYTVTEGTLPSGFTQTSSSGDTGTIASNATSAASFTNTYQVNSLTVSSPVQVEKILSGRNFMEGDSFTFYFSASYSGAASLSGESIPLPANVQRQAGTATGNYTITPTDYTASTSTQELGEITFAAPGTYTYNITEISGSNPISGVSYSLAQYTLTVTVVDNGDGTLAVDGSPSLVQVYDDSHNPAGTTVADNIAAFTNTFNADSVDQRLVAAKVYQNKSTDVNLSAGMFLYRLTATTDGAPMPVGATGGVLYAYNDSMGSISLGTLHLTTADVGKTYTYTLEELPDDPRTTDVDETIAGMTYNHAEGDTSTTGITHTITVTVALDGNVLKPTVTYEDGGTVASNGNRFFNTYEATSTTTTLEGTKMLRGRDMASEEMFDFTLTADSATQTAIDNGYITMTGKTADQIKSLTASASGGTNGDPVSFDFGEMTFTHTGTYVFTMKETVPTDTNGITYDTHECTVTVTVSDNNGTLVSSVDYGTYHSRTANNFENSYEASLTYSGINVSKTLTGRALAAGEFSYTVVGQNGTGTTSQEANGKLSDTRFSNPGFASDGQKDVWTQFSDIQFTQDDAGKTYSYKIEEQNGGLGGVTYDTNYYVVNIAVVDNGDGTLHTVTTVLKNGAGDPIATVDSSTSGGTLAEVPFENTYAASGDLDGATNLNVTKSLSGRDWKDGDSFEFTLEAGNTATASAIEAGTVTLPESTTLTITNTTSGYSDSFGDIHFTKSGDYLFTVHETLPTDDDTETDGIQSKGVTYDESVKYIAVTVTDNGDGTLTCTKTALSSELTFTNRYNAKPATASWNGLKTLEGRDFTDGDVFNFMIGGIYSGTAQDVVVPLPAAIPESTISTDDSGMRYGVWTWDYTYFQPGTPTYDYSPDPTHQFRLLSGDLTFTVPGTYTYQIREIPGSITGMTYSSAQYTCTVVVTDDGEGQLTATASLTQQYNDEGGIPTEQTGKANFVNKVGEGVDVTLNGYKAYSDATGNKPLTDNMFSFQMTAVTDGAPMPDGTDDNGVYTSSNQGSGVVLGSLHFGVDDAGTYQYKVKEVIPDGATENSDGTYTLNGMTYDGAEHLITVVVGYDSTANNVYIESVTHEGEPEGARWTTFTNSYAPTNANVTIEGTKTLTGRDMLDGEVFGFTLSPLNTAAQQAVASGAISGGAYSTTVSGLSDGATTTFNFNGDNSTPFTFTEVGTYTFEMREMAGTAGGMTYDSHGCTVTVTVTDDGSGSLSATVDYATMATLPDGQAANAFVNTYTLQNASVPVNVTKVLTGRTPGLQADEFSFTMSVEGDSTGYTLPSSTTATNAANGSVTFDDITFTKAGTYRVSVNEVVPATQAPFMTYDTHTYAFDVVVSDNNNGRLEYTISNVDGSSTFTNTYEVPDDTKEVSGVSSDGTTVDIQDADGNMVSIGDRMRYTVNWVNDSVDSTGQAAAATVTITDHVPNGTTYVDGTAKAYVDGNATSIADGTVASDGTVTWTIEAAAGQTGTVTFDVLVDESVLDNVNNVFNNRATVTIDDNAKQTNEVHNSVPKKEVRNASSVDVDGESVTVGDVLTFRVYYSNVEDEVVDYTITDVLSEGLTFVSAQNGGTYDEASRTVSWTVSDVQSMTSGYVSFTARVNEDAVTLPAGNGMVHDIENHATLNNSYTTNSTHNSVSTGNIGFSKTVTSAANTTVDATREFTFTVTLKDATGTALTEEYNYAGTSDGSTPISGTITNGGTINLKAGGSVVISDLPTGATWTVTESSVHGYTPETWSYSGTVPADSTANATFRNTYAPDRVEVPLDVTKVLAGDRTPGLQAGEFTFTAAIEGDTTGYTIPTTSASNDADGNVSFGNITFTKAGDYIVTVTEDIPDGVDENYQLNGMTYDNHAYVITIHVTDDPANGKLTYTIENPANTSSTFTNTYTTPENTKTVTKDINGAKTDVNGQMVGVDDTLTYTVHWSNDALDEQGQPIAATIVVTDTIPDGTTFAGGITGGGDYDEDTNTITWNLGTQSAAASGDVSFNVTVDESAATLDEINNTASVTVGTNDPKTTNEVTNTVPKKEVEDTTLNITDADGNPVGIGDVLEYKIHYTNTKSNAVDVEIEDTVPNGTTYVSGSAKGDGTHTTSVTAPGSDGKVKWTVSGVPAGESGWVSFQVTVDESITSVEGQHVNNTAFVQINGDPQISTNETTNPVPKKSVSHTSGNITVNDADGKLVGIGDTLTYAIDWENSTNEDATITITDEVPEGTTFSSVADGGSLGTDNKTVTWDLGTQAAGASGTVHFTVKVDPSAIDLADNTIENTATVTFNDKPVVTNKVTNIVPEKTVADDTQGISDADGQDVNVGDVLTYTVSYKNTETTASTVTITDTVPTGTTFVAQSAGTNADGSYVAPDATGKIAWTIPNVAAGATGSVSFQVKVAESALSLDSVANTAQIRIGDNNPLVSTNTTTNTTKTGNLVISKKVTAAEGQTPTDDVFSFYVTLKDSTGTALTGTYNISSSSTYDGTTNYTTATGVSTVQKAPRSR